MVKTDHSKYYLVYAYCNPLVIIGALYLLLFFSKLRVKSSRFVIWLGASSFAVYLLHSQVNVREVFTRSVVSLHSSFHGVSAVVMISLFLLLTYMVSVLLDQVRILLWNLVWNRFGRKTKDVRASY